MRDVALAGALATEARVARARRTRRWMRRYWLAALGSVIVLAWILVAIVSPYVVPYPPEALDVTKRLLPPSSEHWLGTDLLGRDVFSRLLVGAQVSLFAGFTVALVGAAIGTMIGGVAAYTGGKVEELMMRATDLVLCFPPIILAMAIAAALGIGVTNTLIAMLIVWWPKFARLARSLVIVQRSQEYVEAAMTIGYGPGRILFRHIVPNSLGPLIVLVTLDVGQAILTFSGLSFLGLGVIPPTPEWGAMVSEGRELIQQWWVATFPGLAILTVVMGFNFLGDGVRDWLDPKSRTR